MSTKRTVRRASSRKNSAVSNIDSSAESLTNKITNTASTLAADLQSTVNSLASPSKRTSPRKKVRRGPQVFLRALTLADFITLGNAACGVCSIFCCLNFLENAKYQPYINGAFILLPMALMFDIFDGSVARWRKSQSAYGADLDSLADSVSFGIAPAVLAFTLGCRGMYDCAILSYFVCCVIGRLARFNVTAEQLSFGGNKVKYFEGFPAPTSLCIVMLWGVLYHYDLVFHQIPFGEYRLYGGGFHPLSLLYLFWGTMNISEIHIKKP